MREYFIDELLRANQQCLPEDVSPMCQRIAVLIAFRFAIPEEEIESLCRLAADPDAVNVIYQKYRFYISKTFKDALSHIISTRNVPLAESRFGLLDAKTQTKSRITRIKAKKDTAFLERQHERIALIDKNLLMLQREQALI